MLAEDLSQVLSIEQNAQLSPWARLSFEESLAKEHRCRVVCDVNSGKTVVAYHVVCSIVDELHILNLVVSKECQGQGIAHILLHDIMDITQDLPAIKKILLEVRAGNHKAQQLYHQWQFKQIAIREKYYRRPDQEKEDALVLVKILGGVSILP